MVMVHKAKSKQLAYKHKQQVLIILHMYVYDEKYNPITKVHLHTSKGKY
jgi:hypothetical protein